MTAATASEATDQPADTATATAIGEVTVVRDEATAASATIGIEGGTVSTVDAAGTSYELVIPPGSLAAETAIVMTPADLDGVPFPTATVMFEPTGLEFIVPATLTIVPAVDVPVEDQFIYQLNDDATVFLATLPTSDDDTIAMEVNHFSGYGAASTDEAGRAGLLLKGAAEAAAAIESHINEVTQRHHVAAVIGAELDEDMAALLEAADAEYVEKVITPRIEAASSSCAANVLAVESVLGLEHKRAVLSDAPSEFDVGSLVGSLYEPDGPCEKEAIAKCKAAKDPAPLLEFWLRGARSAALLGGEPTGLEAMIERAKKICKPVTYTASGSSGEATFSGAVPSITAPFVIDVAITGGNATYAFTPTVEGSGSIAIEGGESGVSVSGGGSYTAVANEDGTVTLSTTTNSCVEDVGVCRDATAVITLTPTE